MTKREGGRQRGGLTDIRKVNLKGIFFENSNIFSTASLTLGVKLLMHNEGCPLV